MGCKAWDTYDKTWRHLNFFQYKCFLHFPSPRINCPDCGVHHSPHRGHDQEADLHCCLKLL
ncbi:MAG: transposase family protein [Defluviitaleaceae bacterium]|nr:transposase family protein [Defluviitaleaceae bacterium]